MSEQIWSHLEVNCVALENHFVLSEIYFPHL